MKSTEGEAMRNGALRDERGIPIAFHWYLGLIALMVGLAWARTSNAAPPCLADIQKFCSDAPAGGGKIQACLKSHEADLSKGCKDHVDGLRATAKELAAICVWDIERFCEGVGPADVGPGGGRIATCLQANKDQLSPVCADQLNQAGKD
jgi:Cysteine rich repeat